MRNLTSLLLYRDKKYFDQRSNEKFLFFTIGSIVKITKLEMYHGNWWFTYPGMHIKATTTPCISVNDLLNYKVHFINYPEIIGKIGFKDYSDGLANTAFIFVYWNKLQNIKQPSMYAWNEVYNLFLID